MLLKLVEWAGCDNVGWLNNSNSWTISTLKSSKPILHHDKGAIRGYLYYPARGLDQRDVTHCYQTHRESGKGRIADVQLDKSGVATTPHSVPERCLLISSSRNDAGSPEDKQNRVARVEFHSNLHFISAFPSTYTRISIYKNCVPITGISQHPTDISRSPRHIVLLCSKPLPPLCHLVNLCNPQNAIYPKMLRVPAVICNTKVRSDDKPSVHISAARHPSSSLTPIMPSLISTSPTVLSTSHPLGNPFQGHPGNNSAAWVRQHPPPNPPSSATHHPHPSSPPPPHPLSSRGHHYCSRTTSRSSRARCRAPG